MTRKLQPNAFRLLCYIFYFVFPLRGKLMGDMILSLLRDVAKIRQANLDEAIWGSVWNVARTQQIFHYFCIFNIQYSFFMLGLEPGTTPAACGR